MRKIFLANANISRIERADLTFFSCCSFINRHMFIFNTFYIFYSTYTVTESNFLQIDKNVVSCSSLKSSGIVENTNVFQGILILSAYSENSPRVFIHIQRTFHKFISRIGDYGDFGMDLYTVYEVVSRYAERILAPENPL